MDAVLSHEGGLPEGLATVPCARVQALLAWSGAAPRDARGLFIGIAGRLPERQVKNKFPTSSMPCRQWAHGERDGWRLDVRLDVDDLRHEVQITSVLEEPARMLERLEVATRAIPDGAHDEALLRLELNFAEPQAARLGLQGRTLINAQPVEIAARSARITYSAETWPEDYAVRAEFRFRPAAQPHLALSDLVKLMRSTLSTGRPPRY